MSFLNDLSKVSGETIHDEMKYEPIKSFHLISQKKNIIPQFVPTT
tara:strand:+ start:806 stop:940 length:135 start_codon:yes stop_codon:yes gene_type:complete